MADVMTPPTASSTTASINASIDRSFAGDFVINSGAGMGGGGVDPALARWA